MVKHFFGAAVAAVLLGFGAGCTNDIPKDNNMPVEEAWADPNASSSSTDLNGGLGNGFGNGPGGFGPGANSASIGGETDAEGWQVADPSGNRLGMPIIYFAYDSDMLVPSETANLDRIAAYMANKPQLGLVIEGHCDQRGTEEYNRALGERRANAIRAYLAGKGVSDNRLRTLSYGKDKPAVEGNGESIWAQNRRGVPVPMMMPRY